MSEEANDDLGIIREGREGTVDAAEHPGAMDAFRYGPRPRHSTVAMAELLRELSTRPQSMIVVLYEREQDLQQIPLTEGGLPAQSEAEIARLEMVITEGPARIRASGVREHPAGSGLFEFRVEGPHPETRQPVTMLHYIHVSQVARVAVRSLIEG